MKIKVKAPDTRPININLPNGLIFNPIVATLACSAANKAIQNNTGCKDIDLTPKQMRALFKALNVASAQLKKDNLPLVEVESEDGELVKIIL